jgi:hypothetical protein
MIETMSSFQEAEMSFVPNAQDRYDALIDVTSRIPLDGKATPTDATVFLTLVQDQAVLARAPADTRAYIELLERRVAAHFNVRTSKRDGSVDPCCDDPCCG